MPFLILLPMPNPMKDDEKFFRGMAEDYEHLSPHGITEAAYAEVIATLRQFCAEKAIA